MNYLNDILEKHLEAAKNLEAEFNLKVNQIPDENIRKEAFEVMQLAKNKEITPDELIGKFQQWQKIIK